MLLAHDARLKLGYFDLWRAWRGGPLHVKELEARELDGILERLADGRASWQFGTRKTTDESEKPTALPTFGRGAVGDGHVLYIDGVMPAGIDARFALSDGNSSGPANAASAASAVAPLGAPGASGAASSGIFIRAGGAAPAASAVTESVSLAPGESGLRLKAAGQYRRLPIGVDLRTAGVLGFLEEGKDAQAQPLSLRATIGRANLTFDGSTTDPLHFAALKGRFNLAGPSLAAVGDALGITLPTTPPFKTHGTLVKDGGLWKAVFDEREHRLEPARRRVHVRHPAQGAAARRPASAARAWSSPTSAPRSARRHRAAATRPTKRSPRPAASSPTRSSTCRRCARWTPTSSSTSACSIRAPT